MSGPETANADQIAYWNGEAGQKWVDESEGLDALLAPFISEILDRASLKEGECVLDVGCGGGALSIAADSVDGTQKKVLGVDVSEPLLRLARDRAEKAAASVDFACADAGCFQTGELLDVIISRFGVMFFDDPVAAFSSLRGNTKQNGRLVFSAWQSLQYNPWAMLPLKCAIDLLPIMPELPPPGTPGPFAFADKEHVTTILRQAGWHLQAIETWGQSLILPGDTLEQGVDFLLKLGPAARLLTDAGIDTAGLRPELTKILSRFVNSEERVLLPAAAWIVTAKAI
jgi:2-polyprenyl-3-methyl-5-hydroxy-6-metoxy-1,4-benzoquinol methylase